MIYVIETLEALPGRAEELREELLKIVSLSRQEDGCISYELFQEHDYPHRFAVVMRWKDRKAYDGHNSAPFIEEFMEKFDNILYHNVAETLYQDVR